MKLKFLAVIFLLLFAFPNPVFAADTNYTYTNQELDKSGLLHYDSRYYDPELGRFLQPDSLDVPNKYAYVSNDPVNYTDPTGHWNEFSNFDLFGGDTPNWQMDFGQQSSEITLQMNNQAMYNSNLEYLDGMILNKNIPFSLDNMPSDMSVYANYKSYTPYVSAIKETLIEFFGLDSEAGVLGMVGGPFGKVTSWAKGVITTGKLDMITTNRILTAIKQPYIGNLEQLTCSTMCLGDAARVLQMNKGIGAIGRVTDDIGVHYFPIIEKEGIPWVMDTSFYGKVIAGSHPEKELLLKEGYLSMSLDQYFKVLDKHIPNFSKSFQINPLTQW